MLRYTESSFTFFFLAGLLLFSLQSSIGLCLSAVLWALSGAVRSNGLLFSGFYGWSIVVCLWQRASFAKILCNIISGILVITPFVLFQHFLRSRFEVLQTHYFPYSHIQKKFWNVGFLAYYTPNNIPNFSLAIPTIVISGLGIFWLVADSANKRGKWRQNVPFIVLWAFLLINCVFVANVQIVTRLLSFLPPFYWTLGRLHLSNRRLLPLISVVYGAVGVPLFACFYPPA